MPHNFICGVTALATETGDSPQLSLHHPQPCHILMKLTSPPTHGKMATFPIYPSSAFPPLASATPRLAAAHAPFSMLLPSSVPAHGITAESVSDYAASPSKNSFAYGVLADFALMNTAFPPSDCITSQGAHTNTENQIRRNRRHQNHDHEVPPDKACNLRRHAGESFVKFLFFGDVA